MGSNGKECVELALEHKPDLILLDLNMPRKDGREALWEIRQIPEFRELSIVVLTTSDSQRDKEYIEALYPRSPSALSLATCKRLVIERARPLLARFQGPRHLTGFIDP